MQKQSCRNSSPTLLNWPMASPAIFDHEKLDVYQLELKFLTLVTQFLVDMSCPSPTQTRELREQLDRASLSALLNTAEGNGRRQEKLNNSRTSTSTRTNEDQIDSHELENRNKP